MLMLSSVLRATAKAVASQAVNPPSLVITNTRGVETFATQYGNDPEVCKRTGCFLSSMVCIERVARVCEFSRGSRLIEVVEKLLR